MTPADRERLCRALGIPPIGFTGRDVLTAYPPIDTDPAWALRAMAAASLRFVPTQAIDGSDAETTPMFALWFKSRFDDQDDPTVEAAFDPHESLIRVDGELSGCPSEESSDQDPVAAFCRAVSAALLAALDAGALEEQ